MQNKFREIQRKSRRVINEQGFRWFIRISAKHVYRKVFPARHIEKKVALDILIINGTTLPHPERYRVDHQIEQLTSNGLTADKVFYEDLDLNMLKYYRGFIFFRCPVTATIRDFIEKAKAMNKTCFFDIDDLVIDTQYTDKIEFVAQMDTQDKAHYDDGVRRTNETLSLCDYGITTTERLKEELINYGLKETFINRNTASDEMVRISLDALKVLHKDSDKFIIGYFSGSITHNEDFEMIEKSIAKLMRDYPQVYLKVVGLLDIPPVLKEFKDRIITISFMDWRKMPAEIATCDINLAPLTDSIFNEAKSENKWVEAALVKVITVASNIGAFKKIIRNDVDGILVNSSENWYEAIADLIASPQKRLKIAEAAYTEVMEHHTTITNGNNLVSFITARLAPNIAFVLPTTDISGGVNVVLKHADILLKNGYDVTIINMVNADNAATSRDISNSYNVLVPYKDQILTFFDNMVATLWSTLPTFINDYPNKKRVSYFVQNFETGFMEYGDLGRRLANSTYASFKEINYITMSIWCQNWLKERFGKNSKYASNGIDIQNFQFVKRDFSNRKIKILIEGDSKDSYKKVDESFQVVEKLDLDKYEISYLSYRSQPKEWYHVDHFYNKISPDKVGEVYGSHDILIKSSQLESFSYPPLEMMATGGVSVVVPNDGNAEYLVDEENCLLYPSGNIDAAFKLIENLRNNSELFNELSMNGRKTAESYVWEKKENAILELYPIEEAKKNRLEIALSVDNIFVSKRGESDLNQNDVYKKWVLKHFPDNLEMSQQVKQYKKIEDPNIFSIFIPVFEGNMNHLSETVHSVLLQSYANFEIIILTSLESAEITRISRLSDKIRVIEWQEKRGLFGNISQEVNQSKNNFCMVLEQGDLLWPNALYEYANGIKENQGIQFAYCDEDKIGGDERFNHFSPWFKPDWNEEFLQSFNYVGRGFLVSKDVLNKFVGSANYQLEAQKWEFNLWVARNIHPKNIWHLESILYTWRVQDSGVDRVLFDDEVLLEQQKALLLHHMEEKGYDRDDINISSKDYAPSVYDLSVKQSDNPLISIVIPSKNQYKLMKHCIDSIYSLTSYRNFEVIVVDTGSRDSKVLNWYELAKENYSNFKVYDFFEEQFSYSNSCNFGVSKASGSYVVLLNNDTEIIQAEWLEKMLESVELEKIGCVGVKLWYPGYRKIQHAGIALGVNGVATNLMNGVSQNDIQTNAQHYYSNFTHNITAVTAACLMVRKDIYHEVGGLESQLRITFNDVDFCLKVLEKGYHNVFLSTVHLIHHESISVGNFEDGNKDLTEFYASEKLIQQRWGSYLEKDPNYNNNFSKKTSKFELENNY